MTCSNTINPTDTVAYKVLSMREGITFYAYDLLMIPPANLQIPVNSFKRAFLYIRGIAKSYISGMLKGPIEPEKPAVLVGQRLAVVISVSY